MFFKKLFLIFTIPLFISSCTDNGFLFRSFGTYQTKEKKSIYLIGDPYQINGITYIPQENYAYMEKGDAGWYMSDSDHSITANGEKYNPNELTAMHKTLPLPSLVQVTNLNNGKTEIVRVNDRGPNDNNRIMDVSEKTAEKLDFSETGTTQILIKVLPTESKYLKQNLLKKQDFNSKSSHLNTLSPQKTDSLTYTEEDIIYQPMEEAVNGERYFIQIGAFSQYSSISKIKENLRDYKNISVVKKEKDYQTLHCLRVGPFKTQATAMNVLDKIHQAGYLDSKIISE